MARRGHQTFPRARPRNEYSWARTTGTFGAIGGSTADDAGTSLGTFVLAPGGTGETIRRFRGYLSTTTAALTSAIVVAAYVTPANAITLLNPVGLTQASNDLFFWYQSFKYVATSAVAAHVFDAMVDVKAMRKVEQGAMVQIVFGSTAAVTVGAFQFSSLSAKIAS